MTSVAGNVTVINAGTFATQVDGAALTALQLIDDVVHSGDAALSKYAVLGAVLDDVATAAVTENQAQSLRMSSRRALLVEGVASGTAFPVTQSGTWDEVGINDSGNSITVDNAQLSVVGSGTEATAMRVTIATDSTGVLSVDDNGASLTVDVGTALPAGTNNIGDVDILTIAAGDNNIGNVDIVSGTITTVSALGNSTTGPQKAEDAASANTDVGIPAMAVQKATPANTAGTDGDYEFLQMSAGRLWASATIDAALPAGTNGIGKLTANSGVDIGDVDVTSISAGTNTIGNVGLIGRTTGGMTMFKSIDLDESEEQIKATAGQVFSIMAFNLTTGVLYLKLYNDTAANVIVGTTVPDLTIPIPANADSDGAGFVWAHPIGFAFSAAITAACTTGVADNDTGAPAANACVVAVGYV